jgi:hypothetical protein
MSTRQTACPAPPCVGDASVVMTALGVSVRRVSEQRMTGIAEPPKIDNMVVECAMSKTVNLVVVYVN